MVQIHETGAKWDEALASSLDQEANRLTGGGVNTQTTGISLDSAPTFPLPSVLNGEKESIYKSQSASSVQVATKAIDNIEMGTVGNVSLATKDSINYVAKGQQQTTVETVIPEPTSIQSPELAPEKDNQQQELALDTPEDQRLETENTLDLDTPTEEELAEEIKLEKTIAEPDIKKEFNGLEIGLESGTGEEIAIWKGKEELKVDLQTEAGLSDDEILAMTYDLSDELKQFYGEESYNDLDTSTNNDSTTTEPKELKISYSENELQMDAWSENANQSLGQEQGRERFDQNSINNLSNEEQLAIPTNWNNYREQQEVSQNKTSPVSLEPLGSGAKMPAEMEQRNQLFNDLDDLDLSSSSPIKGQEKEGIF
jgi:hypothetical protein